MGAMHRLVPAKTAVVVIDIQEKLARVMPEPRLSDVVRATTILVESARLLGAPVLEPVARVLAGASVDPLEKSHFSAADAPAFTAALRGTGATDVIVIGMETHVCVYQTVRDLRELGYAVQVAADG